MCQLRIEDVSMKLLSIFIYERIISPDDRKSKNENSNYIVIEMPCLTERDYYYRSRDWLFCFITVYQLFVDYLNT